MVSGYLPSPSSTLLRFANRIKFICKEINLCLGLRLFVLHRFKPPGFYFINHIHLYGFVGSTSHAGGGQNALSLVLHRLRL